VVAAFGDLLLRPGAHVIVRIMQRPVSVSLTADLPPRARSLDEGAIWQIFGGCVREGQGCFTNSDCCDERMNDTGSGSYVLRCIGNSNNNMRVCVFV
jgi:hypothetical protein